jgi:hypothetical protein
MGAGDIATSSNWVHSILLYPSSLLQIFLQGFPLRWFQYQEGIRIWSPAATIQAKIICTFSSNDKYMSFTYPKVLFIYFQRCYQGCSCDFTYECCRTYSSWSRELQICLLYTSAKFTRWHTCKKLVAWGHIKTAEKVIILLGKKFSDRK